MNKFIPFTTLPTNPGFRFIGIAKGSGAEIECIVGNDECIYTDDAICEPVGYLAGWRDRMESEDEIQTETP